MPAPHFVPAPTTIDAVETRRVAQELAHLLRDAGPSTPAGAVLAQAHRELLSLLRGASEEPAPTPRLKLAA